MTHSEHRTYGNGFENLRKENFSVSLGLALSIGRRVTVVDGDGVAVKVDESKASIL
jgi:hypothetical protein